MTIKLPKIDWKWVAIIVLGGMFLFSLTKCNDYKQKNVKLALEKQTTDSIVNRYGQTILTQEAVIVSTEGERDQLKNITDSLFNLTRSQERMIKDVVAYYKAISTTIIKNKLVPYVDTVARKKWADSVEARCSKVIEYYEANTITIPKTAVDSTKNYQAAFTARLDGIYIDSLKIPDSQYIRFVTIKGGILKKDASGKRHLFTKKTIQVQVLHTNDLIKVTGQNSAIYIPPKKARWLEKAILIGGGIFLGTKL